MIVNKFEALLELYEYRIDGTKPGYNLSAGFAATLSFGGLNFTAMFNNFDGPIVPGSLTPVVVITAFKIFDDCFCFGGKSIRLLDGIRVIGVLTSVGDVREIEVFKK